MPVGTTKPKKAGIIGRALRMMLGALLCWMTFTVLRFEDAGFHLVTLIFFLGLMVFYIVVLLAINKRFASMHRWFGAWLVLLPVALLILFGGLSTRLAAAAYMGISLLLQAVRGDVCCEVLLMPSILVNQPTHLLSALFAPIDWVESRLSGPGGMPT